MKNSESSMKNMHSRLQNSRGPVKTIKGSRFNDNLEASENYKCKVFGFDGDDILLSLYTTKEHALDGGKGDDYLKFNSAALRVVGGPGDDELDNYEEGLSSKGVLMSGGVGNDYIRLALDSNSDNWRINSGSGDDEIIYGAGTSNKAKNSKIMAGSGNDRITAFLGKSQTRVYGGKGNDYIYLGGVPPAKKSYIYGGPGRDTLEIQDNFTPRIAGNSRKATLTFSAWQENGIGYQQKIITTGIEVLRLNGEEIFL